MAARTCAYLAFSLCCTIGAGAAGAPSPSPASAINGEDLLIHLNAAIRWHRISETGTQWLSQPSDEFFFSTQRSLSKQVLQKAFTSARAELPFLRAAAPASPSAQTAEQARIAGIAADRASRVQRLHDDVNALDARLRAGPAPDERAALAARKDALQAELDFYSALSSSIQTIGVILAGPGEQDATATYAGRIESLAQSVPEALGGAAEPAAQVAPALKAADGGGLVARTVALFALMKDLRSLDQLIEQTVRLQERVAETQAPLSAVVRDVVQQGERAGEHLTDDPVGMAAGEIRLKALTDEYRQLTGASIPLREELVLLDRCLANLRQWRDSAGVRYSQIVHSVLFRAGSILAMLGIVFGLSALWRHFTFRYVQEDRRRRQFLTVRRFVAAALVIAVIGIGFISDLSSLFTFAGFLTAGIAVALQGIIVSIAAYFFLIGRYGIRVGDRLTVSGVSAPGVTGEVTDLGLVRFHLMELTGSGPEARPTGRTIVFPNSVIFLANPICRQMPGADFAWREAVVPLVPGADAALVRDGLMAAVNSAYAEFRPLLDRRPAGAEKLHGVRLDFPKPYSLLRATGSEIDVAVGYPASLRHAAEIDQIVARHLADALAAGSKLQPSIAGTPRLGPVAHV